MSAEPYPPRVRNAHTQSSFYRETFWQIALPLGLTLTLVGTVMVMLVVSANVPTRSVWADVSLMFLILQAAFWGLLILTIVGGLCVGVAYLLREIPYWLKPVQDFTLLAAHRTKTIAARINEGVLSTRAGIAAAQTTLEEIRASLTFDKRDE